MSKSPLAAVNDDFGGKDKLVDKLVGILPSGEEAKDDLRKRLLGVSNRKLLRLHGVATTIKDTYGSREKLIPQAGSGRDKDKDYLARLEKMSSPQLVDMAGVVARRARRTAGGTDQAKATRFEAQKKSTDLKTAAALEKKAAAKTLAVKKSSAKSKGSKGKKSKSGR